ncbi:MAG: CRISPR-associated endoribonuclease Cas6 [Ruminococcus sp.]
MKILLQFILKNNKLPVDYRRVFLSFFKRVLSEIAQGKYYEKYYFTPQRRNFTFAVNLPHPKFTKSEITLEKNELRLIFSTPDKNTGFVFMSAFIKYKGRSFPAPLGNTFTLTNVTQQVEKQTNSKEVLVKMLSPLCVREHNEEENTDKYFSVESNDFQEKANKILQSQLLDAGFDENMVLEFSIKPVDGKKTVVFHYGSYVECSLGDFLLSGDKAIINYLLQSGIGSRKSAGFGFPLLLAEG